MPTLANRIRLFTAVTCLGGIVSATAAAEDALVAVAANFADTMIQLQPLFEGDSGHRLTLSIGSTGKLYAQIRNGAPFDVLLAADQARPERLVAEGLATPASRFTYAIGRLALWSADPDLLTTDAQQILRQGSFRLAIANPELAPYGAAARETLMALGLYEPLRSRIVMGENVGQAYALVATGNAQLGFLAWSYLLSPRNKLAGSRWDVPEQLYTPIRQDAVLLTRGVNNRAATDLLTFLRSAPAQRVMAKFGYAPE
jgi:molybdate transport system substrate-binding protein